MTTKSSKKGGTKRSIAELMDQLLLTAEEAASCLRVRATTVKNLQETPAQFDPLRGGRG